MEHQLTIVLRPTAISDLDALFTMHSDPEAVYQAAFTAKDPTDKSAFLAHWNKVLKDSTVTSRTVWLEDEIVGTIQSWLLGDEPNISYWMDRSQWGKGLATVTVKQFLLELDHRPQFARVAFDNKGSQRVLEKCGFQKIGEDLYFANARNAEIKEFIFRLE